MSTPLSCATSTPPKPSRTLVARRARRVVLVKRQFSLRYGGGERYSVNLARALAKADYDVTVVGTAIDDDLRDEVKFIPVRCQRHGVRARVISFSQNAAAAVREIKSDAVIGLCLTPEADVLRVTSRIHPHWMRIRYPSQWRYALENLNPRHRALLELERAALVESRRVRAYVVQSQLDRKLLGAYYMIPPDRTHVVRNGVDSETFHPRLRKEGRLRKELLGDLRGPLVVFAANRDFRGKGLATLIEGFAACGSRNAQLAVLGGDSPRLYRHMARRMGLDDRVHFLGRREDAAQWYAAADLMALPTLYEPFPNVVLEAMACGTPALATAQCGAAELINHGRNGYVVSHGRAASEVAEALSRHFSLTESQRLEMQQHARATATSRSLAQNAQDVVRLLDQVAA